MEDYRFLNEFDLKRLREFRKTIVADNSDIKKIELLDKIDRDILRKDDIVSRRVDFSSGRMLYYRPENESKCLELLDKIYIVEIPFLWCSFSNRVNRILSFSGEFEDLYKQKQGFASLMILEKFFSNEEHIYAYEDVYNTYMYIKNYIYYCFTQKNIVEFADVFKDYAFKKKLVVKQFPIIADYLYNMKAGTNLRLSVSPYSLCSRDQLSQIPSNYYFSESYKKLAETIAFGTTVEKLQNQDYVDCKRLLYLPKSIN